ESADRTSSSKQNKQKVAGDDRRQDQRQEHKPVEERLTPETTARQRQGDGYAKGQADQRCYHGDLKTEPNRGPFLWAEGYPMHEWIPSQSSVENAGPPGG